MTSRKPGSVLVAVKCERVIRSFALEAVLRLDDEFRSTFGIAVYDKFLVGISAYDEQNHHNQCENNFLAVILEKRLGTAHCFGNGSLLSVYFIF